MQEKILIYLQKTNKKITKKILIKAFSSAKEEKQNIEEIINKLEETGKIYIDDFDCCHLFSKNNDLIHDKLRKNSFGKYFIHNNGNNIFIPDKYLNGALINDIVLVSKIDGQIKKIVKRHSGKLILECQLKEDCFQLVPIKDTFNYNIILNEKIYKDLIDGDRIIVQIKNGDSKNGFNCDLIEKIGHKNDPDIETKTFLYEKEIPIDFDDAVIKETKTIPTHVSNEELNNRLDLRYKNIFTIDGKGTKDFDDAISIEVKENGNYLLGVHIADVAHYVKPNTAIFNEAFNRGTSVYITNYVIPMLPRELSNGICSLNPNVDRLTLSCIMEIDKNGKVIDHEIRQCVINSKKRMTYDDVNKILDDNIDVDGYLPFKQDLLKMNELSKILNVINKKRGYLDFGNNDIKIEVDENGKPINVKSLECGSAQKLIENFMIIANETVSKDISWKGLPCIYRVHDMPPINSITNAIETLQNLKQNIKKPNNFNSKSIQNIINSISNSENKDILLMILLTGMSKASYSPNNIGHFGLALDYYSHFTSPIRRFPDLMLHTLIKKYNHIYEFDNFERELEKISEELSNICHDNSLKERRAEEIEREINKYKMAEYMEQHIGENFDGVVTYVSKNGITVKTVNHIVGHINIKELRKEGYKFLPGKNEIINNEKNIHYKFGNPIEITVKKVNRANYDIEFSIYNENQKVLKKIIS